MLHKQILEREKQIRQLQKESKINFLIVTFTISLLTILGVFMSHSNSEMFIGGIKKSYISVISTDPVNKAVNEVYKKVITVKFNEEIDPATINSKTFILLQGLNPTAREVIPTSSQTDSIKTKKYKLESSCLTMND